MCRSPFAAAFGRDESNDDVLLALKARAIPEVQTRLAAALARYNS